MIKFNNANYEKMPLDNEAVRVKLTHHVRNISIDKLLKRISDEEIKNKAEAKHEDVYSFGCSNLLVNGPDEFLTYMFDRDDANKLGMFSEKKTTKGYKTMRRDAGDKDNFFVSHNPGEATIIFTSLTNKKQADFVEAGDKWAGDRKIKFFAINRDETTTRRAEDYANCAIDMYPEHHIVFVANNMPSRSFSVPKLVNGVMMVNAPGAAAAEQKFNRLTTFDSTSENKKAHMYWFNFKAMNLVCPLVNFIWNDLASKKNLKDANGKEARTMLDAIDIFDVIAQNDETTTQSRWTEKDIFEEMRRGMNQHDSIVSALTSIAPDLAETLKKMLADALTNEDLGKIECVKLGKASMAEIDCGPSFKKNGDHSVARSNEPSEKLRQIDAIELMARVVQLLSESDCRTYESFVYSCACVIGAGNMRKIGEPAFVGLWKLVDEKIVKPLLEKQN